MTERIALCLVAMNALPSASRLKTQTYLRLLVARVVACELRLIAPQRVQVGAEAVDLCRVLALEAVVHVGHLERAERGQGQQQGRVG